MKLAADKLRILCQVFDVGSVSEVALAMGVSQSSVSYTLDQLRADMNDPLLVKVGRTLKPTPFLIERMPMIRGVVADIESLPKRAVFSTKSFAGSVTVIANVCELMPLLSQVTTAFCKLTPKANLRLLEMGSRDRLLESFEHHRPVCALTVRAPKYPPELKAVPLFESEQVIYYDPAHRGPVNSINECFDAEHAVLDFGGVAKSTVEQSLPERGSARKIRVGAPNVNALASLMKGTRLVCTMQKALHDSVFSELSFCKVPFALPPVRFDLVWHRRDDTDQLGQWMRALILSKGQIGAIEDTGKIA